MSRLATATSRSGLTTNSLLQRPSTGSMTPGRIGSSGVAGQPLVSQGGGWGGMGSLSSNNIAGLTPMGNGFFISDPMKARERRANLAGTMAATANMAQTMKFNKENQGRLRQDWAWQDETRQQTRSDWGFQNEQRAFQREMWDFQRSALSRAQEMFQTMSSGGSMGTPGGNYGVGGLQTARPTEFSIQR